MNPTLKNRIFCSGRIVLIALSTLGTSSAFAQSSVTLYGVVDDGFEYLTNAAKSDSHNQNLPHLQMGMLTPNRFGFRGQEDLGGGLKAIMTLEGGMDPNSGVSLGNRLFGRQALVGIKGNFGAITLGRQKGLLYDFAPDVEPMSYSSYSLYEMDGIFTGKIDNAIKYRANIGNFAFAALFSTGYDSTIANGSQVPGAFRVGKEYSIAGEYANGPFTGVLGADQRQGTSITTQGDTERRLFAAAAYQFHNVKTYLGYEWFNSTIPATARHFNLYYGGLQYQASPYLFLSSAFYYMDMTSADQHPYIAATKVDYLLSKSTHVYMQVGFAKNSNGSQQGLNGYGTNIVSGANQFGAGVGVAHYF
ncbi:porin [Burkholderia orbicola]|uniref:porin n=1 Tax=Burkholderia orbicola TaxID=2978683 RepID=UPI0035C71F2E